MRTVDVMRVYMMLACAYLFTHTHQVESGGLKALFPIFMGRAAARKLKKAKKLSRGEATTLEEQCISIVASLAMHLENRFVAISILTLHGASLLRTLCSHCLV